MISTGIIPSMPPWLAGLVFLAGMLVAVEVGYRFASWRARRGQGDGAELGTIQGGVLGILGLLLGFTYAFAAARADNRKTFVLEEANAIGTAYLRAGLVAEPVRGDLRAALHEYTASRLVRDEILLDPGKAAEAIARSEHVQAKLWPLAARSLEGHAPHAVDSLLLQSINEVIDMHGRRLATARDRVPDVILLMLFFVGLVSLGLTGFANGAAGRRNFFFTTTLALLVSVVVTLIIDLDSPRSGFIRLNQQSLIDLERSMRQDAGTPEAGSSPGREGSK